MAPFRSGTSLITKILAQIGADPGPSEDLFPPSEYNPDGYYQRMDVTDANTRLILSSGMTIENPGTPRLIHEAGDHSCISKLDISWSSESRTTVIKDPRFCFTLYSWINLGKIDPKTAKIIRIQRDIKQSAHSAIAHYDVKKFCGSDFERACKMLRRYQMAAQWHVENMGIDYFDVDFQNVIDLPEKHLKQLSAFLGKSDHAAISAAVLSVRTGRSIVHSEKLPT